MAIPTDDDDADGCISGDYCRCGRYGTLTKQTKVIAAPALRLVISNPSNLLLYNIGHALKIYLKGAGPGVA